MTKITAYKGFDKTLSCRGHKYEVGNTYKHEGAPQICASGFHACEYPLDCFNYYPPAGSRFAEVEMGGQIAQNDGSDSKIACSEIKISAEISLSILIEKAIKFTFSRAKWTKEKESAASATGLRGAASATGYQGAASATGYQGAASATGLRGAASATGYQGAASATGDQGAAVALGFEGKAQAALGGFITVAEWQEINGIWQRVDVKSAKVDGKKIKPLTWYILKNGKFIEA